ncbi:MAG: ATP-binding cassette domain-containing protein [Candidatus Altiarchaeales archaeon]|nr:ATP-binding cassette domain-containing protein [Candidatus Altiarchaeota archaeon]MBU4341045.1 ATP-binding cassette domain-containing protein [Candidatus Altiarchaeota archaeon]MBU4406213.1 ATP-binding cassette domain-containing protein [Candidatus Altiarchaeota archaeon]MBU4437775.1 ATP-binding cassette domain-containing protein [Candidatus Altiarchaeota archaeon]MCG2782089.1 ATP-binding cassette domain-containing protein [Candidatus Altiarchaeales archaeon]
MPASIELKNLGYVYPDGTEALRNISLRIEEGESVAVLGPNGAGKSTLLLHLNGILRGEGTVKISGSDIKGKETRELIGDIGLVFQDPDDQLFSTTVFDDVAFGPLNMNLSKEEVRGRVASALKRAGMEKFEDRCPHNLSFGEKRKVSIATVLSMDSRIMVFDEPLSNLDPRGKREIISLIKELKREGKTIITAIHDVNIVPEIADRIYVLNKEIIGEGTPREVFMNTKLLSNSNLDIPVITQFFEVLSCFGYDTTDIPLSIDEAISHLTRTIEKDGGHIHLHIHEHTHKEINRLKRRHEHQ